MDLAIPSDFFLQLGRGIFEGILMKSMAMDLSPISQSCFSSATPPLHTPHPNISTNYSTIQSSQQPWVFPETPATSAPQPEQSAQPTARSVPSNSAANLPALVSEPSVSLPDFPRNPFFGRRPPLFSEWVALSFDQFFNGTNRKLIMIENCRHSYCPYPWWKPQVPCYPFRGRKFLLGLRGH